MAAGGSGRVDTSGVCRLLSPLPPLDAGGLDCRRSDDAGGGNGTPPGIANIWGRRRRRAPAIGRL